MMSRKVAKNFCQSENESHIFEILGQTEHNKESCTLGNKLTGS